MSNRGLKHSVNQKGFTLIEMSIVLVIIGLIIGGILKGQEIIESSRQKNLITQIDATRAAVETFADRYRALPGDFSCAGTTGDKCAKPILSTDANVVSGDGNGIVGPATATTAAAISAAAGAGNTAGAEVLQFWVHLNVAKLIGGTSPSNVAPASFGGIYAVPAVSISGAGMSVGYGTHDSTAQPLTTHWLIIHTNPGAAAKPALSAKQMFQIDSKTDDGIASTGSFRSDGTGTGCGLVADLPTAGTDYAPASDTATCIAEVALSQ